MPSPNGECGREILRTVLTACAKDASALPTKSSNPARVSSVSPIMTARPEYLLFTEALRHASGQYLWRFLLLRAGSHETITASDLVSEDSANRSELLAVVRGLEAIDGPASVRLFTSSDAIRHGFARGLAQWKGQEWHWERFGRRVPIRDCDLWQRVDHVLAFHTVESRLWGEADHVSDELAAEPAQQATTEATATTETSTLRFDEPEVLVVPKPKRSRRRAESLLEPALLPAG